MYPNDWFSIGALSELCGTKRQNITNEIWRISPSLWEKEDGGDPVFRFDFSYPVIT
jgi:hypothetical protein